MGIVAFDNAEVLDVMGPFEVFSVAGRISEPSMFEVNLASICTGAFILAQAQIITNQEVITHWEDQEELSQRFPDLKVLPNRRWVASGDIYTSGGISAGIDLSLHLVEKMASRDLAERTARQMEYRWND